MSTRASEQRRNLHGFTLVELLVVMAVISILAGLLLPALRRAMDAARLIACANNIRQIGLSVDTYTSDYNGVFPIDYSNFVANHGRTYTTDTGPAATLPPADQAFPNRYVLQMLRAYIGDDDMTGQRVYDAHVCPAAPSSANLRNFVSTTDPDNLLRRANYAFNMYIFGTKSNWGQYDNDLTKSYLVGSQRVTQIYRPSQAFTWADCMNDSASQRWLDPDRFTRDDSNRYESMNSPHDNHVNVLFADNHVKKIERIPVRYLDSEITQYPIFSTTKYPAPGVIFFNKLENQMH